MSTPLLDAVERPAFWDPFPADSWLEDAAGKREKRSTTRKVQAKPALLV
jgi:hypothetical protein